MFNTLRMASPGPAEHQEQQQHSTDNTDDKLGLPCLAQVHAVRDTTPHTSSLCLT